MAPLRQSSGFQTPHSQERIGQASHLAAQKAVGGEDWAWDTKVDSGGSLWRFLVEKGLVHDQGFRPKGDAQDPTKGEVQERHPRAKPKRITETPDNQRHHGSAHDAAAKDARKRAMVFGHGV